MGKYNFINYKRKFTTEREKKKNQKSDVSPTPQNPLFKLNIKRISNVYKSATVLLQ
ncbi:hypothetical protein LguiB_020409 [Lonicera macranthoides]